MAHSAFEGFSVVVPEGWKAGRDEVIVLRGRHVRADALHLARPPRVLRVSIPWLDADEQPGADPDELDALAREWGLRRGIDAPLACVTELRDGLARADASYRIGEDFVEVWFISDSATLIKASYVRKWTSATSIGPRAWRWSDRCALGRPSTTAERRSAGTSSRDRGAAPAPARSSAFAVPSRQNRMSRSASGAAPKSLPVSQ